MIPLSIALGVVGLAAVLAAWHTARAWLRSQAVAADVDVLRSEMRARLDAMVSVSGAHEKAIKALAADTHAASKLIDRVSALEGHAAFGGRR